MVTIGDVGEMRVCMEKITISIAEYKQLKELDNLSSVQKQLALLIQKAQFNKADVLIPDILGLAAEYERVLVDMEEEWDREEGLVKTINILENVINPET
jgi:hypothetical protein